MRTLLIAALAFLVMPVRTQAADDLPPIVKTVKEKLADPGKPFTMFVLLKIKPGKEQEFENAFAIARKETRREKGNVAYEMSRISADMPIYIIYERWANLDALTAHVRAKYITKLLAEVENLADGGPDLQVGLPVAE